MRTLILVALYEGVLLAVIGQIPGWWQGLWMWTPAGSVPMPAFVLYAAFGFAPVLAGAVYIVLRWHEERRHRRRTGLNPRRA